MPIPNVWKSFTVHPTNILVWVQSNIKYDDWMYGSFTKLDSELIDECINEWFKKMLKLARSLPREELRGVADTLRAKLEEFKGYLGMISCICNPGMRGRHWAAISEIAGFKVAPSDEESLHNLLQHHLHKYEKELQDISDSATREHALEKQLDNMQAAWVRANSTLVNAVSNCSRADVLRTAVPAMQHVAGNRTCCKFMMELRNYQ
jgi:Dynein heavy chain, N-terminal region 2